MTTLKDLYQWFGSDVSQSPTGDLMPIDGTVRGQQRVLRRLLTNPMGYIWHPDYGAGLGARVGDTDINGITAIIRGQIKLEDAVAKYNEPLITVTPITGGITVDIQYMDAQAQTPVILSFNVTQ